MAKVKYVEKTLDELFISRRGNSKYTKKYCNSNKGEYEVFTGTTIGSFGFIDTYDYDESLLSYTTDGENAGTLKILTGKYNVGGHRAVLLPKVENIYLEYFSIVLQKLFFDNVKRGDVPSLTWRSIKDCIISVPVDENGKLNLEIQEEAVRKYKLIEDRKKEIKEKLNYVNEVEVDFISNEIKSSKKVKIKEIFDLFLGINPSKTEKESETQVKYSENCLTFNIDGYESYIFYRKGRFTLSEKIRPLLIRDEFKNKLNPVFLKYLIDPIFEKHIMKILAGNEKYENTKLYQNLIEDIEDIEVDIPITKDGEIDLEKQNQIVEKYNLIDQMKRNITKKGIPFSLSNIELNGRTPYIYVYIRVEKLFDVVRGKSKYTKKFCNENRGDYPVYSADNSKPLAYMSTYDYEGRYLTVSVNGIAGVTKIIDGKFSTNADRVVLVPKCKGVNLSYVSNILESKLRDLAKGRKGLERKNEFTKLTKAMIDKVIIPVPFAINAELDILVQENIASKYDVIRDMKTNLSKQVNDMLNLEIIF